jgi:hypothetical protein
LSTLAETSSSRPSPVVPNATDVTEEVCPVMVRRLSSLRTDARCVR